MCGKMKKMSNEKKVAFSEQENSSKLGCYNGKRETVSNKPKKRYWWMIPNLSIKLSKVLVSILIDPTMLQLRS